MSRHFIIFDGSDLLDLCFDNCTEYYPDVVSDKIDLFFAQNYTFL